MVRGKDGYSLTDKELQRMADVLGITLTKRQLAVLPRDCRVAATKAIDGMVIAAMSGPC